MQFSDERNILQIGPPARPGEKEITPGMVDAVRKRIVDAGGTLTVWAVLYQDLYEAKHGDDDHGDDDRYIPRIALNSGDAERLMALDHARQLR